MFNSLPFLYKKSDLLLGFLLFLLTSIPRFMAAQQWTQLLPVTGPGKEVAGELAADLEGNIYLSGTFDQPLHLAGQSLQSQGFEDVFLAKFNTNLEMEWAIAGGGPNFDQVSGLHADSENNILWGGQFWIEGQFGNLTLPLQHGSRGIFLIKYQPDGSLLWGRTIEGDGLKILTGIDTDSAKNIYLTGYFENQLILEDTTLVAIGNQNLFLLKLDPDGEMLWARSAGYEGATRPQTVACFSDQIWVAGDLWGKAAFGEDSLQTNTQDHDLFIAAYDTAGTVRWARRAGGVYEDNCHALEVDQNGNAWLTGTFLGILKLDESLEIQTEGLNDNFFLLSYSPEGEARLAKSLGSTANEDGKDLLLLEEQIVVTGHYFGDLQIENWTLPGSENHFNAFVAAFDGGGNLEWLEGGKSSQYVAGNFLAPGLDGKIIVAGNFADDARFGWQTLSGGGLNDIFVGVIDPGLTSGSEAPPTSDFLSFQIYPNPTRGLIHLQTEATKTFNWVLFNAQGQKLNQSNNSNFQFSTEIDLGGLAPGVYFLKVWNEEAEEVSIKVILTGKN